MKHIAMLKLFVCCALLSAVLAPVLCVNAQDVNGFAALPLLSRDQMLADFDDLTDKITQISPQTLVRKKITGVDGFAELKKLRRQIPKIRSNEEFAFLIRDAITLLQDGHSSLIWKNYLPDADMKALGISDAALKLNPTYDKLFVEKALRNKLDLRLKYIKGEYYNIAPFSHQNLQIASGHKLVKVNGESVHSFVGKLFKYKRMMRWDFVNRRYFSEDFYKANNIADMKTLRLTFADDHGKRSTIDVNTQDGLRWTDPAATTTRSTLKRVDYFSQHEVLYIRVPRMDLAAQSFYPEMIKKVAAGQKIGKVIIDIRDNPGGSDFVWMDILGSILAEPVKFESFILANPSKLMKEKFSADSPGWKKFHAPYIYNTEFAVFAGGQGSIDPAADSIRYDGKIYILQNEEIYSSAGSLAAIGVLSDKMFTVGSPTGRLLGRGISPMLFELPNSKIVYRIEPVIDFLNVKKAEDIFHDQIEIPVDLTIEQFLDRINYKGDLYENDFLFSRDVVFRSVLDLK